MLERLIKIGQRPSGSAVDDDGPVDVRDGHVAKKPRLDEPSNDQASSSQQPRRRANTMFASLEKWLKEKKAEKEEETRRKSVPTSWLCGDEIKSQGRREDREIHWMGLVRWFHGHV